MKKQPRYILPLIILSQFAGTSLWFAGNAILPDIQREIGNGDYNIGNITSAVQFGFISGTLVFAFLTITDRYRPSAIFFISSVIAAIANLAVVAFAKDGLILLCLRFVTGFFLAGIYPVGMKIAADWYEKGLGKALGYLVGALVLGKAFPYLLTSVYALPWQQVLYFTSAFAISGGLLILLLVPDGPYRKAGSRLQPSAIIHVFRSADFRSAAFGYFGHMWELYAFWAFVPVMLKIYAEQNRLAINVPFWAFVTIGIGSIACVAGGHWSQKIGSARVAFYALICSGLCCLCSPFFFYLPPPLFLLLLLLWGIAVIADSPQFSALTAQTAEPAYKGTGITIVICIGFAITIFSIQLMQFFLAERPNTFTIFLPLLAIGPVIGLGYLYRLLKKDKRQIIP
ncbi:MFS transporter [Terrimonas pollutisoli]|uniref:MFS transporter n=1 Tax=Terrimonas pollutisoli TaxID=3034147 RepID=UPI0023EAD5BF|nr:MFS transporter [Terrimonas sp. H1YJ31]